MEVVKRVNDAPEREAGGDTKVNGLAVELHLSGYINTEFQVGLLESDDRGKFGNAEGEAGKRDGGERLAIFIDLLAVAVGGRATEALLR